MNLHRNPYRLGLLAVLVGALLSFPPALFADSGKHHKHGKSKKHYVEHEKTRVVYVFVPYHRERMRDYFVIHRNELPPYYYEDYYDGLPPGIRRQLVVRGHFPPGLEGRLRPFPSGLDRWLGPPPYGTRRVMFGRDAYLLDDRTNLILDIIRNLAWR